MDLALRLGFIGAGNMAQAIGSSIINKGLMCPDQICVSAPTENNFSNWKKLGVHDLLHSNYEVIMRSNIVFLAVKPQCIDEALLQIHNHASKSEHFSSKLIVSVIAGLSLDTLHLMLKPLLIDYRLIKVMPNIALTINSGYSIICPDKSASTDDINLVKLIMSAGGVYEIVPENLMNSVSPISGAGIAFGFTILEAISDGAVKQGVPRSLSYRLAAHSLLGAAKMVLETNQHPAILKDNVCSPGGVTICGIHALEKGKIRSCLIDAVEATTKRSYELGKEKMNSEN